MRFETAEDLAREKKAIEKFVSLFRGSYKKLGDNDIDYRVYDSKKNLIAYVEVKGRMATIKEAFPLCVALQKLHKLSSKRLNPVLIWACLDGIVYTKINEAEGTVKWGGRKPRAGSSNDQELMVYYQHQRCFKYLKY